MAVFVDDIAGLHTAQVQTPTVGTSDATDYIASWEAPDNIKLYSVEWRPTDAITGADTNTRHLNLDNAGTGGAGTTELGNEDFTAGNDKTAGEVVTLVDNSSAPVAYSEGNLFKLESEEIGTGIGLPSGVLIFKYLNN